MKLSEILFGIIHEGSHSLDIPTLTVPQLAARHKVPIAQIEKELVRGIEHEHEHTTDRDVAREIALDHLKEDPKYYEKLEKALPDVS